MAVEAEQAGEVVVAATGLTKAYRRRPVLRGVDLAVRRGEVVALVGENGCGKTTTLRLLAGLLAPDAGEVARRGAVGYCPQTPGLVDHLTADEHLVLVGVAGGVARREALAEGRRVLDALGFPVGDRTTAKDLSGGTRQKLNLALTLLGNPDLLLLDEPYQGFDLGSYLDFWSYVDGWRAAGRAVVVVTHLLTDTGRVDRVVQLRGGRVATIRDGLEVGA